MKRKGFENGTFFIKARSVVPHHCGAITCNTEGAGEGGGSYEAGELNVAGPHLMTDHQDT